MKGRPSAVRVAVLLSLAACLAACSRTATQAPGQPARVSVRFPIPIVEAGQAPFYVAQDNGYYGDEHLAVSFQMGSRELNPVKTVAIGQDTFGVLGGPDTLLVARSAGQPLKAIAVLHRNSNFSCLITLKSSGITKLAQLQGKKIGFNYGHISTDVLHSLLRRNGIHYTEVDVGFDYNQLIAGKIDAEWAFTVTAGLDLPAKGIEINLINPADYGIVTQGYTLFATDNTVQQQPDVVLRFLRATLRGVKFAVENPEAANQTLLKRDPSLDAALSLKRLKDYNAVTSDSEQYPPGYMDHAMFGDTYQRLAEEHVIGKPFDPKDAYTTQFLAEIYRRPFPN
ncbi:MAG TPA: ABC transporter substrate-binding protein [Terriglobia bacterium]|nr:ABC transporter substrate-binding protein [Terriglobia bacterium]